MLSIRVDGLDELRRDLADFSQRRLNAAVATALTRTAVVVRRDVQAELQRTIDRPTPYTVRQLRYTPASADRLAASVGFNVAAIQDVFGKVIRFEDLGPDETPAGKYLQFQIRGGARRLKRFEKALGHAGILPAGHFTVPGQGARMDACGNVSVGQVIQVLSQLRVQLVSGTSRNMSFESRKQIAAQRKAGGRFFVMKPGGAVPAGIYQREFNGKNITPVFLFVRGANYRKRFDFYGVARRSTDAELPAQIRRAITESAARLRGLGPA